MKQDVNVVEAIKNVYNSFISEEISDFNSNVYYSNPDYIKCSNAVDFIKFEKID